MPMQEDFSVFFNPDEFAHRAVIENDVVCGIFRAPYIDSLGGMSSIKASFVLSETDARRAQQDVTVRIVDGLSYRIKSQEPDGTGLVRLMLELQP